MFTTMLTNMFTTILTSSLYAIMILAGVFAVGFLGVMIKENL